VERAYYIVVEGPIGVGKTTLVDRLAGQLGCPPVYEEFDENPFLADFYADQARYAFQTEMFFLLSRFRQQERFAQGDLFLPFAISDYLWEKSWLFARQNLPEPELELYEHMFQICSRHIPQPDLVIYLHAPLDVLMGRIARRGRSYEQSMSRDYMATLCDTYSAFFAEYRGAPVVSVDTTDLNFVASDAAVQLVLDTLHRRPTLPVALPQPQLSLFD
jgi:deoxyguanosine kinase